MRWDMGWKGVGGAYVVRDALQRLPRLGALDAQPVGLLDEALHADANPPTQRAADQGLRVCETAQHDARRVVGSAATRVDQQGPAF